MLFHSWEFAVFFFVVYLVHLPSRGTRFSMPWLLAASYFFYGWWNPLYLLLIVLSTALDYYVVLAMSGSRRRRAWLLVSIINNLALLGFFKYGAFAAENLNLLLGRLGIAAGIPSPGVLLPVGISFYTFQSMSYTIDYYRGHVGRESSFIRFSTFVSLFPQLVAGPIERARNLLPQLVGRPRISHLDITDGLSLFCVGLFKKLVMADSLALYADPIYAAPEQFSGLSLMTATFAFGWQIYFDFSGYTDMARGIARLMGYRLMLNFNNPYLATSLGDYFQDPAVQEMLARLEALGVHVQEENRNAEAHGALAGSVFLFTGALTHLSRHEAKARIKELGGQVASGISRKVTHVVLGDSPGSKLTKALELGLTVITEDEFLRLIGR